MVESPAVLLQMAVVMLAFSSPEMIMAAGPIYWLREAEK